MFLQTQGITKEFGKLRAVNDVTLEIIKGDLPKRALALVFEWASEHRAELMEDWELCRQHSQPRQIQPIE